jgi:hypothetical protein
MAEFVPTYECDVYVSFAPADNSPGVSGEATGGWVASLIERLDTLLGQKLGCKDWGQLWCSSTHAVDELAPENQHRLSHSAMMLVVLSEHYLASSVCQRELATFLGSLDRADRVVDRLVVVQRDDADRARWPESVRHLLPHGLFVPASGNGDHQARSSRRLDGDGRLYATRVDDLSSELAIRLQRLRSLAETGAVHEEPGVFLGEVTEDLEDSRDSIKRYLIQDGFHVLPEHQYPSDPGEYERATREDLERSVLFVQLLGADSLQPLDELPLGRDGLQYECAKELDKPVLRWRSPDLDVHALADDALRNAMTRENVVAVGLEEFKRKVVERAGALAHPVLQAGDGAYVVVNASDVDLPLAQQVGATLSRKGLSCDVGNREDIPLEEISASQPSFGGLLIVYGACPAIWVRQQLWRYRKAMARSENAPPICAVYEGPPQAKDSLRFNLPTMKVIDGRGQFDESVLDPFIEAVRGRLSR